MINLFFKKAKKIRELELYNQELEQTITRQRGTLFQLRIELEKSVKDCTEIRHILNVVIDNSGGSISIPDYELVGAVIGNQKTISKYYNAMKNCYIITNKGVKDYGSTIDAT